MIRFKVADALDSLVPVHQDASYNPHLSNFITVWVPLVDIDDDCGGIIAYEGSQLTAVVEHEGSGAWAKKAVIDVSKYPSRHITMKAGDALLFPPNLLHESAPHRSSLIRYSIDFRVFRDSTDTNKSHYDPFKRAITRVD
jgi:ectoine hydroxylase-related dioxygenase (phytanoyl-CoA dioxygenase family)